MSVYTAHARRDESDRPSPDGIVFVRDGFSFWAFLLGPLWLIWHQLWLVLLGYLVVNGALEVLMSALRIGTGFRLLAMLALAVLMGLEGPSLRRWTLSRRNWRQLDVVVGEDVEAVEHRFFQRWNGRTRSEPVLPGAPPPTRPLPHPAGAGGEIIGLFPQPHGGPR
jgi:hypothetical protein